MYFQRHAGQFAAAKSSRTAFLLDRFYSLLPMARPRKQVVMTFKADAALRQALRGVENRSEFIRSAILAAMDNVCPLCKGSGILSTDQRKHWDRFAQDHQLEECGDCHAVHLVCRRRGAADERFEAPAEPTAATGAAEVSRTATEQSGGAAQQQVGEKA